MNPTRIAITGAAGYLGAGLARRCTVSGFTVLGLDVRRPEQWPDGAEFALQDVTAETLFWRLEEFAPDVLVHLAWIFNPTHSRRLERRVDFDGTRNAFAAAAAAGVRRIVYPSSTTAYGIDAARGLPYREEDPPVPNPAYRYAYYKARVELWLDEFRKQQPGVDLIVLRPCIVIGPSARNIVTQVAGLPVMPRVRGYDPPLQFLHEDDAEAMFWWAITAASAGVYNFAGDGVMLYSEICRAAGRLSLPLPAALLYPLTWIGWQLRILPFPPGLLGYIRYPWVADTTRLREGVGPHPRHTTRQAFAAYVEARDGGSENG